MVCRGFSEQFYSFWALSYFRLNKTTTLSYKTTTLSRLDIQPEINVRKNSRQLSSEGQHRQHTPKNKKTPAAPVMPWIMRGAIETSSYR
jgi:hypothetical protein